MNYPALIVSIAFALAGLAGAAKADGTQSALGLWLNPDQGWVIEAAPCDSGICGTLVSFRKTKYEGYVARNSQIPTRPSATRRCAA